jgi:hypothetical protein
MLLDDGRRACLQPEVASPARAARQVPTDYPAFEAAAA